MVALLISAVIALFGFSLFTAVFMSCSKSERLTVERPIRINSTLRSEAEWIREIAPMQNHRLAVMKSKDALNQYPRSEALSNLKAIHEIEGRRFHDAVSTLQRAKTVIAPTTGTMDNNLAWAGLWTGQNRLALQRSYTAALRFSGSDCNVIHTGMWVEYALAAENTGAIRERSILRYRALRHKYEGCEFRADNRNPNEFAYEVIGAGVLDQEISKLDVNKRGVSRLVSVGLNKISKTESPVELCSKASPLLSLRKKCERAVRVSSSAPKHFNITFR